MVFRILLALVFTFCKKQGSKKLDGFYFLHFCCLCFFFLLQQHMATPSPCYTLHSCHAIDPTKFCLLRGSTKHCQHYANYQHQAMVKCQIKTNHDVSFSKVSNSLTEFCLFLTRRLISSRASSFAI